ncbi:energy-coupling factor transporter transmembrane component T family protein [Mycolicibacterium vinylchloridicum]|uniref:energy-coupling factor transporter transmembrane component T family protein n=1 Tax=Mycolicibacterium vinylchloridicum TaxID=2736928 RepID=UPI00022E8D86|nr:energy-coupling factor transporter transmembrane protein EcfT [Mycolicibacterium vinylchloridicum]EHB53317.1 cobalt transport protein [Mycolicibacterium rhodesiae JS60]
MTETAEVRRRRHRRALILLRPVPGTSPIHRLWAGTKLVTVAIVAVLLTLYPGWPSLILVAALALVSARIAGVPRGALPSIPLWLSIFLLAGALISAANAGAPYIALGSISLGLGGLLSFLQIITLAAVMASVCALVSWTAHVSEVAPAVNTLARPLRILRLPVTEWTTTLSLALRAFPLLLNEFRTLAAARRLRPPRPHRNWLQRRTDTSNVLLEILATALSAAARRADEMGDAITARGGTGQITATRTRPHTRDAVAILTVLAIAALAIVLQS